MFSTVTKKTDDNVSMLNIFSIFAVDCVRTQKGFSQNQTCFGNVFQNTDVCEYGKINNL